MRRFLVSGLLVVAALGLWVVRPVRAADEKLGAADQQFLMKADEIDMSEVRLGKVAQEHASSEAVRKFGERMVHDHSRMNKELRELAQKKGVTLPENLNQKHQQMVDQLAKLRGAEFDRTYSKDMVPDHEKAIELFENEAQNGTDPDVKAFAAQGVKILEGHLRLARETVQAVQAEK
jgi:putative membrane protein